MRREVGFIADQNGMLLFALVQAHDGVSNLWPHQVAAGSIASLAKFTVSASYRYMKVRGWSQYRWSVCSLTPEVRPTTSVGCLGRSAHHRQTGCSGTSLSWLPRRSSRAALVGSSIVG